MTSRPSRLKTGLLWTLAAANVALAGSLVARYAGPNAAVAAPPAGTPSADEFAQRFAQQGMGGNRGEYLLIPGRAIGAPVDVVYVIDTVNGIMGGIAPDNGNKLSGMPPINLRQVFDNAPAARPGRADGRDDNNRR